MRFSSALFTVVIGLVGTACAAPMDAAGADSLNARGLPLKGSAADGPLKLAITYKQVVNLPNNTRPPKANIEKAVMLLVDAAAEHFAELRTAKASSRKIELEPTNEWKGKDSMVMFEFTLPECGGKPCQAHITTFAGKLKEGKITSGDGHELFAKSD